MNIIVNILIMLTFQVEILFLKNFILIIPKYFMDEKIEDIIFKMIFIG